MKAIFTIFLVFSLQSAHGLKTSDLDTLDTALSALNDGNNFAQMLRLAFHDCVGGCDGCLNVDDDDNAGLADIVTSLESVYDSNNLADLSLSRADFWAYAGIYAVTKTVSRNNRGCTEDGCSVTLPDFNFQSGRVDCETTPYTDADVGHPSDNLDYNGLISYMANEFGFNENETVALMGAHTLGGASQDNSGHRGTWVSGEASWFNKNYYTIMIDSASGWTQRNIAGRDAEVPIYQWNSDASVGFMLNADMAIYKDIQVDSDGASSCDFEGCSLSPTADLVTAYAASNDVWITDFVAVYNKMIGHGDFTLVDLES